MNVSFFNAAVGAQQQQQRMNIQANNIANVNTHGYRAKKPAFYSLLYQNINGIDNAQLPRGAGTRVEMAATDFRSGPMIGTAGLQTYGIDGEGFFALVDAATNEVSYTREGNFSLSQVTRMGEDGLPEEIFYLSDGMGRMVLSNTGAPIEVTDQSMDMPVGIFDFVNRDGMLSVGDNRLIPVAKNGQVRMGTGVLRRGVLEASNTDLAVEFGKVIEAQRSYSYALKMVQTSDEIETTINGLR